MAVRMCEASHCSGADAESNWRLDFALNEPGTPDKHIEQFFDGTKWSTLQEEIKQFRDGAHQRWRVINSGTGDAYAITPGQMTGRQGETIMPGGRLGPALAP